MYKVYIKTPQQTVVPETKTTTNDRAAALTAFENLINHPDFQWKKLAAVFSYNAQQLAYHRFDQNGTVNDWRGRIDEINNDTN